MIFGSKKSKLFMRLCEILNHDDECNLKNIIVSSHDCMNEHYFITWNFNNIFELWFESNNGQDFLSIEQFIHPVSLKGKSLKLICSIGDNYFDQWLEAIP